ncbi:MAG: hypothetical protein IKV61_04450 [Clostridia bacterium]|nr:hypothetical protein [Clostridia bacterium]
MKTIAIDLGTTTIKCALYENGVRQKYFGKEYELIHKNGRVYQNANDWVNLIGEGIKSFEIKDKIDGICISSQGITILPIDNSGKPLSYAESWLDVSATSEIQSICNKFGREYIFNTTGKKLMPDYSMPKIMRMNKEIDGVYKFLMPSDYIYFLLCGEFVTDYTMASGTMLFDVNKREYDKALLDFCGIKESQLAKVVPFGSLVGYATKEAQELFGLPKGTPVIMGAQDQKCSAVYCDINDGVATVSVGTSSAISTFIKQDGYSVFAFDKQKLIYEHAISTTGAAIKWVKNLAFSSYEEMNECALSVGGSNGVVFDTDFEKDASIQGLKLSTTKGELAYAVFNGVAKKIASALPKNVKKVILFGGGTKSSVLVSEVTIQTGAEVVVPSDIETALAGANRIIEIYYEENKTKC